MDGMVLGIVAVVAVAAGALGWTLLRSRGSAAPSDAPAVVEAPTAAAAPPRPEPPARAAPIGRVMLERKGLVLGAVPPYGTLEIDSEGRARFAAATKIVGATASSLLGGDGGSTMQSLGTMEMGAFEERFSVRGADVRMDEAGHGVWVEGGDVGEPCRLAAVVGSHEALRAALAAAAQS